MFVSKTLWDRIEIDCTANISDSIKNNVYIFKDEECFSFNVKVTGMSLEEAKALNKMDIIDIIDALADITKHRIKQEIVNKKRLSYYENETFSDKIMRYLSKIF